MCEGWRSMETGVSREPDMMIDPCADIDYTWRKSVGQGVRKKYYLRRGESGRQVTV